MPFDTWYEENQAELIADWIAENQDLILRHIAQVLKDNDEHTFLYFVEHKGKKKLIMAPLFWEYVQGRWENLPVRYEED